MEQKQRDRLIQFINLATNEGAAPGECQNALGRATKIIREHFEDWEKFVARALGGARSGQDPDWWQRAPGQEESWSDRMRREADESFRKWEQAAREARRANCENSRRARREDHEESVTRDIFLNSCRAVLLFGKYKDWKMGDVMMEDASYLGWIIQNVNRPFVVRNARIIVANWTEYSAHWYAETGKERDDTWDSEEWDDFFNDEES